MALVWNDLTDFTKFFSSSTKHQLGTKNRMYMQCSDLSSSLG